LTLLIASAAAFGATALAAPAWRGVAPQGDGANGAKLTASCAACHGTHGNSVNATFPNLAGQNYNYLLKQLAAFRSGRRKAQPMSTMIGTVPKAAGEQNLKDIAAYFASQKLDRSAGANAKAAKLTPAQAREGYRIYQQGLPGAKVPACAACHGADGTGLAPMAIPALAGQHADYLQAQLKRFADGSRRNSPNGVMALIAGRLTPQQMHGVALYAQQLRPALVPGSGPLNWRAYIESQAGAPEPGLPASAVAAQ
jgi:cytochrome c553